jgi:hypothetical protein
MTRLLQGFSLSLSSSAGPLLEYVNSNDTNACPVYPFQNHCIGPKGKTVLKIANGATVQANDNWAQSPQVAAIRAAGLLPSNAAESAIFPLRPLPGKT